MDFFESQDAARKKTGRLVFLFVLAVVSIIVSVYVVVSVALLFTTETEEARLWHPGLFMAVVTATVAVVACGSLRDPVRKLGQKGWYIVPSRRGSF